MRRNIQEQRQLPEWQTRDAVIRQKKQQARMRCYAAGAELS
jgi:hypothetical protein